MAAEGYLYECLNCSTRAVDVGDRQGEDWVFLSQTYDFIGSDSCEIHQDRCR